MLKSSLRNSANVKSKDVMCVGVMFLRAMAIQSMGTGADPDMAVILTHLQ
jgi:hypothetical protein